MKWTDVKPRTENWYWWRDKSNATFWFQRIYLVYEMSDGRFEVDEGERFVNVDDKPGQWSDAPIAEPEEG